MLLKTTASPFWVRRAGRMWSYLLLFHEIQLLSEETLTKLVYIIMSFNVWRLGFFSKKFLSKYSNGFLFLTHSYCFLFAARRAITTSSRLYVLVESNLVW